MIKIGISLKVAKASKGRLAIIFLLTLLMGHVGVTLATDWSAFAIYYQANSGQTTMVDQEFFECPNSSGGLQADQITKTLTGLPPSVTYTYTPNPVSATVDPSAPVWQYLNVTVPASLPLGTYNVTRTVTGVACGWGGPYPDTLQVLPTISSDALKQYFGGLDELWYLDGEDATQYGYEPQYTLTASPTGNGPYTWTVTAPDGDVAFATSNSTTVTTTSNSIVIVSTGPTKTTIPMITVTAQGATSKPYKLVVISPTSQIPDTNVYPNGIANYDFNVRNNTSNYTGFETDIWYTVLDQFGEPLSNGEIPLNEYFENGPIPNYTGENWSTLHTYTPTGTVVDPTGWADDMSAEEPATISTWIPTPLPPQSPLTIVAVHTIYGVWNVGSVKPGAGSQIQANAWIAYQDHGLHKCIISPAPIGTVIPVPCPP